MAILEALKMNGYSKADAARKFGVKPPSITGWIQTGRISKSNFDELRRWLTKTPQNHWINDGFDIDEIRRINIRELEEIHGPDLYKKACMSPTQFYNLRDGAKDSKTGKPRGMRKETAWKIEDAAGVPRGYLDILHGPTSSILSYSDLTTQEQKLINVFRSLSSDERRADVLRLAGLFD